MREVFWESVERFARNFGHNTKLLCLFLQRNAALYAVAIKEHGKPSNTCIRFMACTQICINRPNGHEAFIRIVYFGHKRSIAWFVRHRQLPIGLCLLYGLRDSGIHEMMMHRKSRLESTLSDFLPIDRQYCYVYKVSAYLLRSLFQRPFS